MWVSARVCPVMKLGLVRNGFHSHFEQQERKMERVLEEKIGVYGWGRFVKKKLEQFCR